MAGRRAYFSEATINGTAYGDVWRGQWAPDSLEQAVQALELAHLAKGLLEPYRRDYPLVEPRELTPPFDAPLIEHRDLPAFSMVVLDRQLDWQQDDFQYDPLIAEGRPRDRAKAAMNRATLRERLPRNLTPELEHALGRRPATELASYFRLLPLLMKMDRGHVLARDEAGGFQLGGVYASFPSDLDGEVKRFGRLTGKLVPGDKMRYLHNRRFIYHFIMEHMGFPICGERHTSAAMFARRLMRRGEGFAVRVLGHSDRALTTLTSLGAEGRLPRVEKAALVSASGGGCGRDNLAMLREEGFFVDKKRAVVLLRVGYVQHAYHKDNVLEDRALSVFSQEVIHPVTGRAIGGLDVLGVGQDRLLLLGDIVRGEFQGSIVYRGRERVQGTGDVHSRLRFLAAWLRKHHFVIADYTHEHFERISGLVHSYLEDPANRDDFQAHPAEHRELLQVWEDLKISHRLRLLEKMVRNRADSSGRRLKLQHIMVILSHMISEEAERLAQEHPRGLTKLLAICRNFLDEPYVKRRYGRARPGDSDYARNTHAEYQRLRKLTSKWQRRTQS